MRTRPTSLLACGLLAIAAATGCRSTTRAEPLDDLVAARSVDVVYAAESHDDVAHHAHQLALLSAVAESARADGVPALFGMEMFQRPFQSHLDDYVAGRINEIEMLRRTEYFTRWQYDHTFYAPLWRYCRDNGVRIIALNVEKGISRQIGREGLASLTPEQRAQVADEIQLDVAGHRARLMPFFQSDAHPMPPERVEAMYEAMTVWDETMAETAADALTAAGPGARMLVIAGSMHIQGFNGIPDRVTRRLSDSSRLVVVLRTEDRDGPTEDVSTPELGDVVIQLAPIPTDPPSRMGVQLGGEPRPEGFVVESVVEGGNADRAGIEVGDVLKFIGAAPITDMTDLRYTLDRMLLGTTTQIHVVRDGRPRSFELTFAAPAVSPHTAP